MPLPVSVTIITVPVLELLVRLSEPDAAARVVGANFTCKVIATPGFKVTGKMAPEDVNSAPVMAAALIVTGELPVEVSIKGKEVDVLRVTSPKLRLLVLNVRI